MLHWSRKNVPLFSLYNARREHFLARSSTQAPAAALAPALLQLLQLLSTKAETSSSGRCRLFSLHRGNRFSSSWQRSINRILVCWQRNINRIFFFCWRWSSRFFGPPNQSFDTGQFGLADTGWRWE